MTTTTTTSIPIPSGVTTVIALLLLFAASSSIPSATAALTLTVEPFAHQAIEVGQDAQFVCTRSDKGATEDIVWTFSKTDLVIATSITTQNQNTPQQTQQSASLIQRATNVNGTLKIQNATESDKGTYVCSVVVPAEADPNAPGSTGNSEVKAKASVQLVVYTMPAYTEELVGIAMVCLGLMVALILLSLHKSSRYKKRYPPPQQSAGATATATTMQASFDNSGVLTSDEITIVTVVDKSGKKQCEF